MYNAIRDLKLHFPNSEIQVCIWVDRHNLVKKDGKVTTDWEHFGTITELKLWTWIREWQEDLPHLACSLSHLNVIKDALDKWYENILIAEDDLLLWRWSWELVERFYANAPEDREILRLSWKPFEMASFKEVNLYRQTWEVWWAELYMLNKKGIKKFYDNFMENNYASTDIQMNKAKEIMIYISKYSFGIQRNNYETDNSDSTSNKQYKIIHSEKWTYTITNNKNTKLLSPIK